MARILIFSSHLILPAGFEPMSVALLLLEGPFKEWVSTTAIVFFKESNYQYYKPRWKAIVLLMRMFVRQNVILCDAVAPQKKSNYNLVNSDLDLQSGPVQHSIRKKWLNSFCDAIDCDVTSHTWHKKITRDVIGDTERRVTGQFLKKEAKLSTKFQQRILKSYVRFRCWNIFQHMLTFTCSDILWTTNKIS